MNFAKLISTFKGITSDSKRNEHLEVVMEMIDRIDGETFKALLDIYTSDSYRNEAIGILTKKCERIDNGILLGVMMMYTSDSYRDGALKLIMHNIYSIMNTVSIRILQLYTRDSYRVDATKEIVDKITKIDEEVIYQLLGMYTSDSCRVAAGEILFASKHVAKNPHWIKLPEKYLGLFQSDSYRSECFKILASHIDNENKTLLYCCAKTFTSDLYRSKCVKSWTTVGKCIVDSNILDLFQSDSDRLKALKYLKKYLDLTYLVTHTYIVSLFNSSYAVEALKIIKPIKQYDVNDVYCLIDFIDSDTYKLDAIKIIVTDQKDIYSGQSIDELISLLRRFKDCETISNTVQFIGKQFKKDKPEKDICEKLAEIIDGQNAYKESCDALKIDPAIYEPFAIDIMPELPKNQGTDHTFYTVENDFTNGHNGDRVTIEYIGNNLVKKTVVSPNGNVRIIVNSRH